jgi:hypothetical protein
VSQHEHERQEVEVERPAAAGITVASSFRAGARDPVVACLLLAALFDGISGNAPHSLLFVGTAVALAITDARARVGLATDPPSTGVLVDARHILGRSSAPLLATAGVAFALIVGWFGRYSWPATLPVLVAGAFGIAFAWGGPLERTEEQSIEPIGVVAWAVVIVALSGWELTNLFLQPSLTTDSYRHPTISVMSDPFFASRIGRAMGLFAWLRVGWGLVRR